MTEAEFREAIADVLEIDPALLTPETRLDQLESFDSVAALSLMVTLGDLGVEVSHTDLNLLEKYKDIIFIAKKMGLSLESL
jgi:acyl carrier protein